ncbi:unnamed protein product [Allacma fusca]|uniref:Uncharacterized protein n=1 Tax=Allacma fusca TaxID=39272 RepID=A0A8J2NSS8_9HEXA|nr:unnamed protein product [Allacma fusca]
MANCHLKDVESELLKSHELIHKQIVFAACREVRRLQLLIQLFNSSNCFVIFTFKFMCITLAIVGGFFTIRYSKEFPTLGMLCVVVILDALIFFGFIYEKAFQIPNNIELLKEQILVVSQRVDEREVKEVARIIKSVPTVWIKVGSFHTMEQEKRDCHLPGPIYPGNILCRWC